MIIFSKFLLTFPAIICSTVLPLVYSVGNKSVFGGGQRLTAKEYSKSTSSNEIKETTQPILQLEKIDTSSPNNSLKVINLEAVEAGKYSSENIQIKEIKNVSTQKTFKSSLSAEKFPDYQKFIYNIINFLRGPLWWGEKYENLWIYKVEATFPKDKLKIDGDKFEYIEEGETKKASLELTPFQMKGFKKERNKLSRELQERLNLRASLVSQFFDKDWNYKSFDNLSAPRELDFALTEFQLISITEDTQDLMNQNVLRFARKFENQNYYLDLYFYGKQEESQLQVSMVRYKDKDWNTSAYYQGNGAWSKWRNHIGGSETLSKKMNYVWTEIDQAFAKIFSDFNENPSKFQNFIEVISRCLNIEECATLFHTEDYPLISQRAPGISRANSWNPAYYRNIHPFSKLYYEVAKSQ